MYREILAFLQANPGLRHGWGQLRLLREQKGWTVKAYESAQTTVRCGHRDAYSCPRFVSIDTQTAALFGYWVAEGSATGCNIDFASHRSEHEYRDEISTVLTALAGRPGVTYYVENTNGCNHKIGCKPLAQLLVRLFGATARSKHLPAWWIDLPNDVLVAFLRALFNGDGCCFQSGARRRVSLRTASRQLSPRP